MKDRNPEGYYSLVVTGTQAELLIYGDIVPYEWFDSDVTAHGLVQELAELEGVDRIIVRIKSFGGDVNEGLAIYNALRANPARVVTRADGFACSIASVIFMAGEERVMCDSSLLMIHNPWTSAWGANAAEMRKLADDLDKIAQASKTAYLSRVSISPDELDSLLDDETWITPQEALEMGFATDIETFEEGHAAPSQCARRALFELVTSARAMRAAANDPDDPEPEDPEDPEPENPEDPEDSEPEEPDDPEPEEPEDPEDPDKKSQEAQIGVLMALDKVLSERSTTDED